VNPIAAKRKELGLTQQQVARLLGTKQSNVSAYEKGVLTPGSVVEQRFAALLALPADSDSAYFTHEFPTLASQVVELRGFLDMPEYRNPEDQDSLILRMIIDTHDRFQELNNQADQVFFLLKPGSSGVHRADVAFAGMTVHWARLAKLQRVPSWTRNPELFLQQPWFADGGGKGSRLRARSVSRGVPALRARGIFMAETNLESI
jgi:transcriptional regulator with XRE-family HTH domain